MTGNGYSLIGLVQTKLKLGKRDFFFWFLTAKNVFGQWIAQTLSLSLPPLFLSLHLYVRSLYTGIQKGKEP